MTAATIALQEASVAQQCKLLHLPAVGGQFVALAEQAVRERQTHVGYLEALLATELEERERHAIARRLKEAHLPRVKTLDEFDFSQAPHDAPRVRLNRRAYSVPNRSVQRRMASCETSIPLASINSETSRRLTPTR
jgi:DNA replication protein DnaC